MHVLYRPLHHCVHVLSSNIPNTRHREIKNDQYTAQGGDYIPTIKNRLEPNHQNLKPPILLRYPVISQWGACHPIYKCKTTTIWDKYKRKPMKYFIIMDYNFSRTCPGGVLAVELGCDEVLFSLQRFKILVNAFLDTTSLYWYFLEDPKELARLFFSSVIRLGGVWTNISLKLSIYFLV